MRNVVKGQKITWVDIQNPTRKDLVYLKKNFKVHPLVLGELMPFGHRPKVERHKKYLFMTVYCPVYSKEERETRPRELDIIVTKDCLITSHYLSIIPLKALFDRCNLYPETKKRYLNKGSEYILFLLLSSLWKSCLTKLDRIDKRIDHIEREIFQGKEKEMVRELSLVKTDIINFWRIVEPQGKTLESLSLEGERFFGEKFSPYLADIMGTYSKGWNALKTYKETILALEETNRSLLSTKTNEIIQMLTVFSVIMLPLTLIASMWGMNFKKVPFDSYPNGFWVLAGLMVILMLLMIVYFKRKKWM